MKRGWPDHPAVGMALYVGKEPVTVVDVKAGPGLLDMNSKVGAAVVHGTLKLRIKYASGHEEWTAPMEGEAVLAAAESFHKKQQGGRDDG